MMIIGKSSSELKRTLCYGAVVSGWLIAGYPMLTSSAQTSACAVGNDLLDWRTAGPPKPPPPEKTAPPITAPDKNPAVPADVTKYPFAVSGKFLSAVNNEKRYCVAQFVEGGDILLTAGHCIRNKNGVWLDQFNFTPAASTGPGDSITDARCFATKSDWVSGAAGDWFWPSDYAFVLLKAPASKQFMTLDSATTAATATAIGYPLQIENGSKLYRITGPLQHVTWPGTQPIQAGEDFGTISHNDPRFGLGVSGGAWISTPIDGAGNEVGRIVGMNSTTAGDPIGVAGPIFGSCTVDLLQFIRKACPAP
jgi:hypothetical protein